MTIRRFVFILGLFATLQGCVKHINYNDPNLTLNNFTEQMAKNQSSPYWTGKQINECSYSIPVRMQFSSRSSPSLNPIFNLFMEYDNFCRLNRGGRMASEQDIKKYSCVGGGGTEIFSVYFDGRPEEEFYLKSTGHFYRNGNIFITTTLSVDKEVKDDSDGFMQNAKIQPQIVDESGYFENETLAEYRLAQSKPLLCSSTREDLRYFIDISTKSYIASKYVISWEPLPRDIKYSKDTFQFEPKIVVRKRIFNRLYPGSKIFNDGSVEIKVQALSPRSPWEKVVLRADLEIKNKTNKYIDMKALSLHFGGRVYNSVNMLEYQNKARRGNDLTKEATLPPNSLTKISLDFSSASQGESNGNILNDQNKIVFDKKTAESTTLDFAVSAKLEVGGKPSTFFKTIRYTLADMLISDHDQPEKLLKQECMLTDMGR